LQLFAKSVVCFDYFNDICINDIVCYGEGHMRPPLSLIQKLLHGASCRLTNSLTLCYLNAFFISFSVKLVVY